MCTARPEITHEDKLNEPQSLKAGATLILLVNVKGIPTPKVTWFQGEDELVSRNGTTVETTDDFSRLTVKKTTAANAGTYRVTAENVVDTAQAEFTAVIKGERRG